MVKDGKITQELYQIWEKDTYESLGMYTYESKIKFTVEDEQEDQG